MDREFNLFLFSWYIFSQYISIVIVLPANWKPRFFMEKEETCIDVALISYWYKYFISQLKILEKL